MTVAESTSQVICKTLDQREHSLGAVWHHRGDVAGAAVDETPRQRLQWLIDGALEVVFIATSAIDDRELTESLVNAVDRGVRVYLLAPTGLDSATRELCLRTRIHVRLVKGLQANLVLSDPSRTRPSGLLFSSPLTTPGLDGAATAVELGSAGAADAFELLRYLFWERAEQKLLDKSRLRKLTPEDLFDEPQRCRSLIHGEDAHLLAVLQLIDSSEESVRLATEFWRAGRVHDRILACAGRGRSIQVLTRPGDSNLAALQELVLAGVEVTGLQEISGFSAVVDGQRGLVASGQVEGRDQNGLHVALQVTGDDLAELEHRLRQRRRAAPWRLIGDARLGGVLGKVLLQTQRGLVEREIVEHEALTLPDVTAPSVDKLHVELEPTVDQDDLRPLAHELELTAVVRAPRLSRGARRETRFQRKKHKAFVRDSGFEVFREPDGRQVVVIKSVDEMTEAQQLRDKLEADAIVLARKP